MAEHLVVLTREAAPGVHRLERPVTPLSSAALITNAPEEPSLSAELRAELGSADRVDLLCAFVRWHGLRVLEAQLDLLQRRGVPFRVITTTYVGATEKRAVDALVRRFRAHVKISYETRTTRLHAKAWLFHRNTGFDTAFVGSSNLSRSALVDGLEWNVRLSSVATPDLIRKFAGTFDSYWADPGFVAYDPDDAEAAQRLTSALGRDQITTSTTLISGLEVRPYPHQTQILEGRRGDRYGQDRCRGAGLRAAACVPPARPAAVRRASPRDPRSGPPDLPGGHGRRDVRRGVRRR
jgi:HKD family nuclease